MPPTRAIRANSLRFSFADAVPILSGATFHLPAGWTGIVGPNGAGKSTLLRLVAGLLVPQEGSLAFEPERPVVRLCRQEVEVLDADVRAFAADDAPGAHRLRGRLGLWEGELERWETLSPGERRRWQVGAALAAEPDVLLLDEPTNHLDADTRAWLLGALSRFRGVGLVVSHDRELLEALTTHTLRLDRGEARLWRGAYEAARREWEAEAAREYEAFTDAQERARALEKRLADLRRERDAAEASRSARHRMRSRHDSDARGVLAQTRADWAEAGAGRKVGVARRELERGREALGELSLEKSLGRSVFVGWERPPQPILAAVERDVLEVDGTVLVRETRCLWRRDDRLLLAGPNGAGKTTLVNALLAGARVPRERLVVLPQELTDAERATALEELRETPADERGRILSIVAALGVEPERLLRSALPSPGEARKLVVASGLARHAWGLVLDEPTNHLDLPSVERLERALSDYPGALLLVSHDARFAESCRTRRWFIDGGVLHTVPSATDADETSMGGN